MNKELIVKNAKKHFEGELLEKVLKQIDTFFEVLNSDYITTSNYKVGDDVVLTNNHLLHGIGIHEDVIDIIAKRGVVSLDFLDDNSNHAFCYVSAFWKVKEEIELGKFVKNYSGIIAKVNNQYEQIPYGELDSFVEKMRNVDHWLWTAESSMEIRFMPSLARDVNQVGFILNVNNVLGKKLKDNAVFNDNFTMEENFNFVDEKSKSKFENGFVSDFFERAEYIIFGIPSNFIEGVLVGRKYENDMNKLEQIKKLLPNAYICDLDGKVIME